MCLSSSILKEILTKTSTGERLFSSMDVEPFIQNLSLLFDMHPGILHNFDDAFEIGELTMCNNDNHFKTERLLVREDIIPIPICKCCLMAHTEFTSLSY
jgi:hypothetical protein